MLRSAHSTFADRLAAGILFVFPRLLGGLFIYTAVQKILHPEGIGAVFKFDGFPDAMIQPMVWVIIGMEFVLAAGLILFLGIRRTIVWAATAMLLIFSVQIGYLLIWEKAPDCGCMGATISYENARRSNILSLIRNISLLVPCFWTLVQLSQYDRSQATSGFPIEPLEKTS